MGKGPTTRSTTTNRGLEGRRTDARWVTIDAHEHPEALIITAMSTRSPHQRWSSVRCLTQNLASPIIDFGAAQAPGTAPLHEPRHNPISRLWVAYGRKARPAPGPRAQ